MEVVIARGARRLVGLAGRRDWPAGVALEIPRCRSVHTFGMRFALDLVWLGAAGEIVRIDRAVPPWRVRSCRRARSVLELRSRPAEERAASTPPSPGRGSTARSGTSRASGSS
jgi:uncharacterized membrane protein (UPF0127 family)